MVKQTDQNKDRQVGTRRQALKLVGSGAIASALSGCLGGSSGGGSSGGGTDTIKIGSIWPLSGGSAVPGKSLKRTSQLAVEKAKEADEVGGNEVELLFRDSELKSSTARKHAQNLAEEGVDFFASAYYPHTSNAVAQIAKKEEIPFYHIGASEKLTGEGCHPLIFNNTNTTAQMSHGGIQYALETGMGSKIFQLSQDDTWGQLMAKNEKEIVLPKFGGTLVDSQLVQPGQSDFSSSISRIKNSDADMVVVNIGDQASVAFAKQAQQAGLFDELSAVIIPYLVLGVASQMPQELMNRKEFLAATTWYWELDTPASKDFVNSYYEMFNKRPQGWDPCAYTSIRHHFKAMTETGSRDPYDISAWLENNYPIKMWGVGEYLRECDHQLVGPYTTVRGADPSEIEGDTQFKNIFDVVHLEEEPEKITVPCEETGCEMD